jgi:hypothetical protein
MRGVLSSWPNSSRNPCFPRVVAASNLLSRNPRWWTSQKPSRKVPFIGPKRVSKSDPQQKSCQIWKWSFTGRRWTFTGRRSRHATRRCPHATRRCMLQDAVSAMQVAAVQKLCMRPAGPPPLVAGACPGPPNGFPSFETPFSCRFYLANWTNQGATVWETPRTVP